MSGTQSRDLERINLVSVGVEWFRMSSVQAGLQPFGVGCRRLWSGEGIPVEDVQRGPGLEVASNRL